MHATTLNDCYQKADLQRFTQQIKDGSERSVIGETQNKRKNPIDLEILISGDKLQDFQVKVMRGRVVTWGSSTINQLFTKILTLLEMGLRGMLEEVGHREIILQRKTG